MARKGQGPRQPLSQTRPKVNRRSVPLVPTSPEKGPPTSKFGKRSRNPGIPGTHSAAKSPKPASRGSGTEPEAPSGPVRRSKTTRSRIGGLQAHAREVFERLLALYPNAHCELDFKDPYQLLVATILSAQTTDRRVNMVTPVLFARYPDATSLGSARQEEVEEIIRSTGFFRTKARNIIAMAGALVDHHGAAVPASMASLVVLPGVGRKTANVVLGNAWSINEGVVVDTHVARVGARLGLTRHEDPLTIEQDLIALFPREIWTMLSHLLIWHGRRICEARKPRCAECPLNTICPSAFRA